MLVTLAGYIDVSALGDGLDEILGSRAAGTAPGTGEFLFRNAFEDYSLRPKAVALQPSDQDQGPLIIRVISS